MTLRLTKPPLFGGSQDNININYTIDSGTSRLIPPNQGLSATVNPKNNSNQVHPSKINRVTAIFPPIGPSGAN